MKRLLLLVAAVLVSVATTVQAQMKVDQDGIMKRIAKSDADIQDAKKNAKSSSWLERGKVYTEAAGAPTAGLYKTMDEKAATLMFGKATESTKKFGEVEYKALAFPYFEAYLNNNAVACWTPTLVLKEGALDEAYSAYLKAYEIDNGTASKVKDGLNVVINSFKQNADNYFTMQMYKEAADAFRKSYEAQLHPSINYVDTSSVFNAGFLSTVALDYEKGLLSLKDALRLKYDNDGDLYYYMFHCYYGLKDNENAKDILFQGLAKYPKNNKIVEGLLGIYSSGGGDPKEIVPVVEGAIKDDPTNPELWGGLGRIYDKLGDSDKSIEAFAKAAELSPNDFGANFNLGLLYIKKGDAMNQELNTKVFPSQTEYNAALATVNAAYSKSIPTLEIAHKLDPKEVSAVELLKNVYFRLRDEPGMNDKYNAYNELLKTISDK